MAMLNQQQVLDRARQRYRTTTGRDATDADLRPLAQKVGYGGGDVDEGTFTRYADEWAAGLQPQTGGVDPWPSGGGGAGGGGSMPVSPLPASPQPVSASPLQAPSPSAPPETDARILPAPPPDPNGAVFGRPQANPNPPGGTPQYRAPRAPSGQTGTPQEALSRLQQAFQGYGIPWNDQYQQEAIRASGWTGQGPITGEMYNRVIDEIERRLGYSPTATPPAPTPPAPTPETPNTPTPPWLAPPPLAPIAPIPSFQTPAPPPWQDFLPQLPVPTPNVPQFGPGSFLTPPGQAQPNPYADAIRQQVLQLIDQPDVSLGDPELAGQMQAFERGNQRGYERSRNRLAERRAAEGISASDGSAQTELQGLEDQIRESEAGYGAQLVGQRATERRQQVMQALQMGAGLLTAEQENVLRRELANLESQMQTADLNMRGALGFADLGTRRDLGLADLGLRRDLGVADIQTRRDLGFGDLGLRSQLGQGDLDLRGRLGQGDIDLRRELGTGDLRVRGDSLNLQRQLGQGDLDLRRYLGQGGLAVSYLQAMLQNQQFNDRLGLDLEDLIMRNNYNSLLLGLGG